MGDTSGTEISIKKVSQNELKFGVHLPGIIARKMMVVARLTSSSIKSHGLVNNRIQHTR